MLQYIACIDFSATVQFPENADTEGVPMNYREVMNAFSDCGLGAILVAANNTILDINAAGEQLLHCQEKPQGQLMEDVAPFLLGGNAACFGNPAFNKYLLPCPMPALSNLPPATQLFVFRDATKDFRHDLLENVFNQVSEAITIWDGECRILMLNDAAAKLESHLINNVLGKHVTSLYQARNDTVLVIPLVIENKKPILNLRQDFVTHSGKELQILSNNYPILRDGCLIGATSLMEDWTKMDELAKRIIELQGLLVERPGKAKKDHALPAKFTFNDIIFGSGAMRKVIDRCKQVADSDSSVMLYGETGTGKELFAQSIHNASRRAKRPFIAINCAAIPETLLESMLFGTEKGAYTGAESREGLFEQADGGTLLLDEINSMDLSLQSKLLRVLEDGMIRRVGGVQNIHVDVRVLSNSNVPPLQAVEQKLLRQDLYHRLGVVNITIPPLRERKQEIMLLVKNFIVHYNKKMLKSVANIDVQTLELFHAYDWPGNVRELQYAIESAMNLIPDDSSHITPEFTPEHIQMAVNGELYSHDESEEAPTIESVMREAGQRFLRMKLQDNGCNISKTAQMLGLTRQNLQQRMKRLHVALEDFHPDAST